MPRASVSVVIITKNEADNIKDCLQSVEWADEIVVFDSGSTDCTLDIARRYTDKIYMDGDWPGFGPQRRRAQEKAGGDWILALDADEVVTPELKEEILVALKKDNRSHVYFLPRLTWSFGSFIRHSGWHPDYVARLYPRENAQYDEALVHEKLEIAPDMSKVYLKGNLLHFTFRDLEHWVKKTARYAAVWADERERKGEKASLGQGISHGLAYFLKTYFLKKGFLDGRAGLLLALLGAYSRLLKYADLWIRNQPKKPTLD